MEGGDRKTHALQENEFDARGKINSAKGQDTTVRQALGEIEANIQDQEIQSDEKYSEIPKKNSSNNGHVHSTINTGISTESFIQPSSSLRRGESTGGLTTWAALKTKDSTESLGKLQLVESSDNKLAKKTATYFNSIESSPTLPDDIEDIDAGVSDPHLGSVYIKDSYRYLSELECKYRIEVNHLNNQNEITRKMRSILINWLVEVQWELKLLHDTFQLAVGIIDRYLQVVPNVPKYKIQLVGVTAMYIAHKYEETFDQRVRKFAIVTNYACSEKAILRYERKILVKLGYCLTWPTPITFLRRFIKVAHGTSENNNLAKYFVDLCLVDNSMTHYLPSELSAAAVCLSLFTLSTDTLKDLWTPSLLYYTGYTLEFLKPIIIRIAKIVMNKDKYKFNAVTKKYKHVIFKKVSALPQLKSEAMYDLAGKESI